MVHALIFVVFCVINLFMLQDPQTHFTISKYDLRQPTWVNAIYITSTTHTSTGYGDISPKSLMAKMYAVCHQTCVFLLMAGAIAL